MHPNETDEYTTAQGIDGDPSFNWWVPHVIKKRSDTIYLVKKRSARYLKKTHKFGVDLPKSANHALKINKKNGNNYWLDAIAKEMKSVQVAFKILDEDEPVTIG